MSPNPSIVACVHDDNHMTADETAFFLVMQRCFDKFVQRNRKRHGVWRMSGLNGQTHEIYAKAERAYVEVHSHRDYPDRDHFEDLVNYAIFAQILMDEAEKEAGAVKPYDEIFRKVMYGTWPR
jgi:hypothetical protein